MRSSGRGAAADDGQGQHRAALSVACRRGVLCALVVQACGGATPEAETPTRASPAEAPVPHERIADEAEQRSGDPAPEPSPAPEPAPAPPAAGADDGAAEAEGIAIAGDGSEAVSALALELAGMSSRFDDALGLASPDCDAAERFRDAVCSLSERICEIAQAGALSGRCSDGRRRCAQSRQRYAERCGD